MNLSRLEAYLGQNPEIFWLLLAWSLAWKAMALWRSARQNDSVWFLALFLLQTAGILEILYLFVFSKRRAAPERSGNENAARE